MKQVEIIQMSESKWHVYDNQLQMLKPDFQSLNDAVVYCKNNNLKYNKRHY